MSLGPMEIAIVAGVFLLLFGPSQIPRMGKALGESIKEFRKVGKELSQSVADE
jgi:sec-independent protein translocase protein TatA